MKITLLALLLLLLFLSGCSVTNYRSKGWDAQSNLLWDIKLSHSTAMNNTTKDGLNVTLPDGVKFGLQKSAIIHSPESAKAIGKMASPALAYFLNGGL